jgi:hypothetical protein
LFSATTSARLGSALAPSAFKLAFVGGRNRSGFEVQQAAAGDSAERRKCVQIGIQRAVARLWSLVQCVSGRFCSAFSRIGYDPMPSKIRPQSKEGTEWLHYGYTARSLTSGTCVETNHKQWCPRTGDGQKGEKPAVVHAWSHLHHESVHGRLHFALMTPLLGLGKHRA